jgi:signal peptidase I
MLFYVAQLTWAILAARRADGRLQGTPSGTKIAVVVYITITLGFVVFSPATLCVESFRMPSASMIPTILPGDCFWVDKLYDARRGDVVVYKRRIEESDVAPARETVFVGRIVGLEGDSIELRDGDVYLNSRRLETARLGESKFEPAPGSVPEGPHTLRVFKESYPGREHLIAHDDAYMEDRSAPLSVVPEGHFFILGDNRENANDSRFTGTFPVDKIVGRVSGIYWSSSLEGGVDWSRIGEPVN